MLQKECAEVCVALWENADGLLRCRKKENELAELYRNKELNSEVYSETASRLFSNMNDLQGCDRYLIYGYELARIKEGKNTGKGIKSEEFENALNKTDYNKDRKDMVLLCVGNRAEKSLVNICENMKTMACGECHL